jgi:hypothetical protein
MMKSNTLIGAYAKSNTNTSTLVVKNSKYMGVENEMLKSKHFSTDWL